MRTSKYIMGCLLSLMALTGCNTADDPLTLLNRTEMAPAPKPPMEVQQTQQDIQRRFQASEQEKTDAVQSAVMWAERYEQLSLKNNELREQNNKLVLENNELKHQTEKLQITLDSTRNELAEANEFLGQMHAELSQWKSDVLGYRDEMRQAQKAQLEALAKILKLLGAEPTEDRADVAPQAPAAP